MRKNTLKMVLAVALLSMLLTACGGSAGNKKDDGAKKEAQQTQTADKKETPSGAVVIKVGHVEPEDRSTNKALVEFKKAVEEKSKGSLSIEIYPNGALGGDVQLAESVAMGTVDAALPSTSVLTTYSDDFGILDMPYLFKNSQDAFAAMDGDVGKYFDGKLKEKGLYNLGYTFNGIRSTTTNTKAIEKPDDLKGIKMRVMESPIFTDYYKTLGANPTPMGYTELYTGLQQGTVEAEENPPTLILANKFYEVQKYLSLDEHVNNFLAFIINPAKFDSLTDEQKEILTSCAKDMVKAQREMELNDTETAVKKLQEVGLKVNRLSEEQKQAFKDALKPMYEKYEQQFGKELFDMCNKYNK